jgi:hypothetical protein
VRPEREDDARRHCNGPGPRNWQYKKIDVSQCGGTPILHTHCDGYKYIYLYQGKPDLRLGNSEDFVVFECCSMCEIRGVVIWAKLYGEFEFRGPRACGLHKMKLGFGRQVGSKINRNWVDVGSCGLVLEVRKCVCDGL